MLKCLLFFAQANDPADNLKAAIDATTTRPFLRTDTLIVLGVLVLLATLLFFWVFFLRRRPVELRGSPVLYRSRSGDASGTPVRRKRRKRRPDHPDNLPRNPTLGETGGLPPLRPDESPPPRPSAPSSPQPTQSS